MSLTEEERLIVAAHSEYQVIGGGRIHIKTPSLDEAMTVMGELKEQYPDIHIRRCEKI